MSNPESQIIVMGVGRSGTTMLYSALQKILADCVGSLRCNYEPFLWDRDVFDIPFTEVTDEFTRVSSLSVDGMYHHRRLPMFVSKSDVDALSPDPYLRFLHDSDKVVLTKYIRANGRLPLIRSMYPNARIILMLRNPVDSLNSSIGMFSFYGDEFHASDRDRFLREAEQLFPGEIDVDLFGSSDIYAELVYWQLMTKKLIHDVQHDDKVLLLPYEVFRKDRESALKEVVEFIGCDYQEDHLKIFDRKVGPVHSGLRQLDENDYRVALPFLDYYRDILDAAGFEFDPASVTGRYQGRLLKQRVRDPLRGRGVLYLLKQLEALRGGQPEQDVRGRLRSFGRCVARLIRNR